MVGGIDPDDGVKLYMTDPSGAFWGYFATAIGSGAPNAREYLQKEYDFNISFEDLKLLTIRTLKQVIEGEFDETKFELGVIEKNDKTFRMLKLGRK